MEAVRVSSKYQIVIPKPIRELMNLKVGETLQVVPYGNRIELVPIKPMKKLKGFLKGINTDINREKDRI
jgi:AbrB family looped-hinge helix DNA binding protein